jgi:hypothetical protein
MKRRGIMRTAILAVLVLGFTLAQSDRGRAQATLPPAGTPGAIYLHVINQCRVTIAKNGTVLGALTFNKGTLLSAVDAQRHPTPTGPGRFEFHGVFELRALPSSEAKPGPASDMMPAAPVVLSGQGVDVLIENIP